MDSDESVKQIKKGIEEELLRVKKGLDNSEKECTTLQARCTHLKDYIKFDRTQPTGEVEVKINLEQRLPIKCVFTFPDGIQTSI
ncbi:hypothetical protein MAR_036105 [Mya arenaria]|uniref:Uncharacterized protein n=1 Tax=Mya arenaria TaxID=6604 RepID=A0ABY7ERJ8_MYAAR|nr:hypothetical protein MAR_036105 [Mya arenaria]